MIRLTPNQRPARPLPRCHRPPATARRHTRYASRLPPIKGERTRLDLSSAPRPPPGQPGTACRHARYADQGRMRAVGSLFRAASAPTPARHGVSPRPLRRSRAYARGWISFRVHSSMIHAIALDRRGSRSSAGARPRAAAAGQPGQVGRPQLGSPGQVGGPVPAGRTGRAGRGARRARRARRAHLRGKCALNSRPTPAKTRISLQPQPPRVGAWPHRAGRAWPRRGGTPAGAGAPALGDSATLTASARRTQPARGKAHANKAQRWRGTRAKQHGTRAKQHGTRAKRRGMTEQRHGVRGQKRRGRGAGRGRATPG
jgi:hypothetical protein